MTALPIAPDLLKLARTTLGLSQRDLAAELATHQTCVQAWESGRRAIPADHLPTLWAVLFPDAPGSAPSLTDHTTQEAACADRDAPRSGARVSTADVAAQAEPGVTKRIEWHGRLVCHTCGADTLVTVHGPRLRLPPITCGRCRGGLIWLEDVERRVVVTVADSVLRLPRGRPPGGRKAVAA